MERENVPVMICAGDYSGDRYGGMLVGAIKEKKPRWKVFSLGGKNLELKSDLFVHNLVDISMMGFWEPLRHVLMFKNILDKASRCIAENKIRILVLIDYYGFNIHLARRAFGMGVNVFYFVSPQVWASRYNRVRKLKKYVKKMFVIFPFEEEIYKKEGIPVEFIGHPLGGIAGDSGGSYPPAGGEFNIGILPGSRKREVLSHLPVLMDSAGKLSSLMDNVRFFLFLSSNISDEILKERCLPKNVKFSIVRESDYRVRSMLNMAWSCSGTAVLENAFLGIPTICFYRTSWLNYCIARMLVKIEYIAMPNILAGKEIMPELIQTDFNSCNLVRKTIDFARDSDGLKIIHQELKCLSGVLKAGDLYSELVDKIACQAEPK